MRALWKLCSYPNSILRSFFLSVVPKVVRISILVTHVIWKHYKVVASNHMYMSSIDERSSRFSYVKRAEEEELLECSICLSGFEEEDDEVREVLKCKHAFHRQCLERWLLHVVCFSKAATCPLCRSLVVPEAVVAEYQRVMKIDREDGHWAEKELALILLNTFHCPSPCNIIAQHSSFTRRLFG